jgi:excinuclease ABC subunit C
VTGPDLTGGRAPACIRRLPDEPGVYRFRDARGRALYLGRAVRLRRRVRSYWGDLGDRRHLARMVPQIVRVEALVCASDHEACWLERSLLEQSLPRWNRAVGGAEVPFYLALDVTTPTPRLRLLHHPAEPFGPTRRPAGRADVYGPFLGGAKVRLLAGALHRVLPLAYTAERLTGTERDLGRIRGVGAEDRRAIVATCRAILQRRPDAVAAFLGDLTERRDIAARRQSYELAGRLQQELQAASWLLAPQRVAEVGSGARPPLELYGWQDGLLLQLSWVDGRIRRWHQRTCSAEAAAPQVAATPAPWREFVQRNARLAATLRAGQPVPV